MEEARTFFIHPGSRLPATSAAEAGSKAWNLMRMAAAGLPVPPAFVLTAEWCRERRRPKAKPAFGDAALVKALASGIASLEQASGLGFGSARAPLLVSVRSGSAVSMPGMMRTVLDVGLNPELVEGLIGFTGNPRLAWDCYRRLIQSYAEVVYELPGGPFEELVRAAVGASGSETPRDLDFRALRKLAQEMLDRFRELAGVSFPSDPNQQLARAADAVLRSWDSGPATAYRKLNGLDDEAGSALTLQRMVFGNAGGLSGSGVGFTRNPATGDRELYLDFAWNGQGEDVVAGRSLIQDSERLRRLMPETWKQLSATASALEALFRDAQDFEFTVENGSLYLLQTRSAKRTPWADLRIAVDLVEEKLISPKEGLSRVAGIDLSSVARTRIAGATAVPLSRAQVASIGIATGAIAFDSESAGRMAREGQSVILVRPGIAAEDIEAIASSRGILTASGGRTSHAAVVARQLGKVCLVACPDLEIDGARRICRIGGRTLREGDLLSLDGNEGGIYAGAVEAARERPERELAAIAQWRAGAAIKRARTK